MRSSPAPLLLVLMFAVPGSSADEIPAHPRNLAFPESTFQIPAAEPLRHVLDNGVVTYVAEDHSLPLVDIVVAVRAGAALEAPESLGVAGLTGTLLRRAGGGDLGADDFDEAVDFLGAEINSQAGDLRAVATLNATTWTLDEALDLFFAMLASPRFEEERLADAKSNLVASMARRNDDPLDVMEREWRWLLFGREHVWARQLTPPSVIAVSRADLLAFHRAHWGPSSMVVAVSGDVATPDIVAALNERFRLLQSGKSPGATLDPGIPEFEPVPGIYLADARTPQAKVVLGHRSTRRRSWEDPDAFALLLMDEILGGTVGVLSRLNARLRGREGLVYRVYSQYEIADEWAGEFRIFFDADPASVGRALEVSVAEIDRIRSQPVHPRELEIAKQELASHLPLQFDAADEVAGYFAEDVLLGRPHAYWRDYRRNLEAVTAADVQRVAREHLHPEGLIVLVVGPGGQTLRSALEEFARVRFPDGQVTLLPPRDPLTLEP